eukprot:2188528-Pleurochrysis_carterae.AAC.2
MERCHRKSASHMHGSSSLCQHRTFKTPFQMQFCLHAAHRKVAYASMTATVCLFPSRPSAALPPFFPDFFNCSLSCSSPPALHRVRHPSGPTLHFVASASTCGDCLLDRIYLWRGIVYCITRSCTSLQLFVGGTKPPLLAYAQHFVPVCTTGLSALASCKCTCLARVDVFALVCVYVPPTRTSSLLRLKR